jgi:hypothetical protein
MPENRFLNTECDDPSTRLQLKAPITVPALDKGGREYEDRSEEIAPAAAAQSGDLMPGSAGGSQYPLMQASSAQCWIIPVPNSSSQQSLGISDRYVYVAAMSTASRSFPACSMPLR